MKLFVFFVLVAICLLCDEASSTETCSRQSNDFEDEISNYPQLRQNAFVIAELEDRIQKLKVKLNTLSSAPSIRKIYDDIRVRVKRLEGTGCSENEFQCGGNMRQCVSEMLACDGIKDCKNGKDEDPAFCDTSALKPAAAYATTLPMDACMGAERSSYHFRADIVTVHRSKIYPPLVTFRENNRGYVGDKLVMNFVANGEFQSGTRRTVAYAPDWLGLRRQCVYPDDNFDQSHCLVFKEKDYFPCGKLILHKAKPYS